jgi:hypothetical protein
MASFAAIAGAETAPIRDFGRHVFDITVLLRVSITLYNRRLCVVGTTGIEPVTPTMSTKRVDGNYTVFPARRPSNAHRCSRSDQGNLGRFLGPNIIVQRDDGMWSIGWHDDAAGPFESRTFAEAVAARVAA